MNISGFTITRNAIKYNYPILESIHSILPICDEFIVNVGDSDDGTLKLIQSIESDKIRIIQNKWNFSMGPRVLSYQTNLALRECSGHWAFYLQSDEVVHESDLPILEYMLNKHMFDPDVDAFRFKWMHFYGSYYRYRVDHGWYQKQDRIIRNSDYIESEGDAWGFRRKDGESIRRINTNCLMYHYGWVQPPEVMAERRKNADDIGFIELKESEKENEFSFGDLNRFPAYFGSHPKVMRKCIADHRLSEQDYIDIEQKYKFHPLRMLKVRYKTGKRVREKIT